MLSLDEGVVRPVLSAQSAFGLGVMALRGLGTVVVVSVASVFASVFVLFLSFSVILLRKLLILLTLHFFSKCIPSKAPLPTCSVSERLLAVTWLMTLLRKLLILSASHFLPNCIAANASDATALVSTTIDFARCRTLCVLISSLLCPQEP